MKLSEYFMTEGIRPVTRPRARWKDQVHKYMREMGLEEEDSETERGSGGLVVRLITSLSINGKSPLVRR